MTEFISQIKIRGHLSIVARDARTGRVVFREDKPNLVVQGTKGVVAHLLAQVTGTDANENRIWGIYVGDSSDPPVSSQTALLGAHITKKAVNQPMTIIAPEATSGIVEAEVTFSTTDHVDEYIREVGLFSRGNDDDPTVSTTATMMARQIHGEIFKTAAITVTYTWRYQITV